MDDPDTPDDLGDVALAESVAALMDWLEQRFGALPEERRSEMAVNVLLNGLGSVLEEIRHRDPARHGVYLCMSLVMLGDD